MNAPSFSQRMKQILMHIATLQLQVALPTLKRNHQHKITSLLPWPVQLKCRSDESILEVALRSGLKLPYDCQLGECLNCS